MDMNKWFTNRNLLVHKLSTEFNKDESAVYNFLELDSIGKQLRDTALKFLDKSTEQNIQKALTTIVATNNVIEIMKPLPSKDA